MSNAELTLGIIAFIVLVLPIFGALWRIFSVKEELSVRISDNNHAIQILMLTHKEADNDSKLRVQSLEREMDNHRDMLTLSINQTKELLEHVRERSKEEERKLSERIGDVESFLEKTTTFNRRRN